MRIRRKTLVRLGLLAALAFAGLQASAYMHAYRMTHFVPSGRKTASPQELSPLRRAAVLLTGVTLPRPHNWRTPPDFGLRADTVELRSRDGTRLSAWFIPASSVATNPPPGQGLALLFHGYGTCKSHVLPDARFFHNEGWDVFMPDFRGCGDSEGAVTTLGMREAEDVAAAVAWAKPRLAGRPLVLFGGSMGAAAVLRALATGQIAQPTGVVLEAPFDRLLHTIRRRFDAMGVPSFPAAESLTFWGGRQHGFNGFTLNPADDARHVHVPTLVLIGGKDPWVSVGQAFAVATRVSGPHVLRVFPGAGHESLIEASPDLYREVVGRWLRELPPPATW